MPERSKTCAGEIATTAGRYGSALLRMPSLIGSRFVNLALSQH